MSHILNSASLPQNNSTTYGLHSIGYGEPLVKIDNSLTVKGSIVMNGTNLEDRLSTIETVLNIPTRDVTLEEKYPRLKEIYIQYITELEKYKNWEKLKDNK